MLLNEYGKALGPQETLTAFEIVVHLHSITYPLQYKGAAMEIPCEFCKHKSKYSECYNSEKYQHYFLSLATLILYELPYIGDIHADSFHK